MLSLNHCTTPIPQVKVSALPRAHESTRSRTLLAEPFAQTWQCLQPPVGVGVKIRTRISVLKSGFHFESPFYSHHFLHEISSLSPKELFSRGCFSFQSFRQLLGDHVESSDTQMTSKSVESCLKSYFLLPYHHTKLSVLLL